MHLEFVTIFSCSISTWDIKKEQFLIIDKVSWIYVRGRDYLRRMIVPKEYVIYVS